MAFKTKDLYTYLKLSTGCYIRYTGVNYAILSRPNFTARLKLRILAFKWYFKNRKWKECRAKSRAFEKALTKWREEI